MKYKITIEKLKETDDRGYETYTDVYMQVLEMADDELIVKWFVGVIKAVYQLKDGDVIYNGKPNF